MAPEYVPATATHRQFLLHAFPLFILTWIRRNKASVDIYVWLSRMDVDDFLGALPVVQILEKRLELGVPQILACMARQDADSHGTKGVKGVVCFADATAVSMLFEETGKTHAASVYGRGMAAKNENLSGYVWTSCPCQSLSLLKVVALTAPIHYRLRQHDSAILPVTHSRTSFSSLATAVVFFSSCKYTSAPGVDTDTTLRLMSARKNQLQSSSPTSQYSL